MSKENVTFISLDLQKDTYLQVNNSVSAEALHRVELEVSLEILCIEASDWQPVTKASLLTKQEQDSVPYNIN